MDKRKWFAATETQTAQRWAVCKLKNTTDVLAVAKESEYCVMMAKSTAGQRFELLRTSEGKPVKINAEGCGDIERRVSKYFGQ